ncbi:TonB-dependent receptor [Algoriphagus sp.]|uniref:TonB-dependent receptor n=1 Tax=Algoriphagus sp. TaxID=1872435 RepID=UPI00271E907C|nr:TonB-dependent receptor [Algoriphagus sp.]MDO8968142.1 TonB-dependent receptor [Algoriphagus sp.]MDP3202243.1 TonB-dependent receptor [Algoriphagus sp.]
MQKLPVILFFAGAISLGNSLVLAQNKKGGAVQDQEFVIRKDRVLTVPTQPRSFERLPVLPQPKGIAEFNYTVTPFFLNLPALNLQPTALEKNYRLPNRELYNGFIRAGYGNFASPLLEGRYMSTTADPFNYAVKFKHQNFGKGPVAAEQSSESHTVFGADGSYFMDAVEIFGGLNWGQDKYSFYGVNPILFENPNLPFETNNNVLNNFQVKAGFRDIEKTGTISYEGQFSFRNFRDSYAVKENEVGVQAGLKFRTDSDWSGKVDFNYFHTNPNDINYQEKRNYFSIRPRILYNYEAFQFTAGLNLVSENDPMPDKSSDFRIFPVLKASYQFADEFGFYGAFSGDVQRNTYFSFVNENPFLGPSEQLLNTINNYKVEGGIDGQFQEAFHYRAGINVSRFNNLHFFANSFADSSRFEIVYDDKSTVFNINAELGFKISEVYSLGSRLDLYQYDLNSQPAAWHRPLWEVRVNNQFTPFDKLLVQANVNFMGGLKARGNTVIETNPPRVEVVNLKTIADLQLKADFKISNRLSIFAEGNNILNGKNTRWLNYPVRGIQLVGGASFKF